MGGVGGTGEAAVGLGVVGAGQTQHGPPWWGQGGPVGSVGLGVVGYRMPELRQSGRATTAPVASISTSTQAR